MFIRTRIYANIFAFFVAGSPHYLIKLTNFKLLHNDQFVDVQLLPVLEAFILDAAI